MVSVYLRSFVNRVYKPLSIAQGFKDVGNRRLLNTPETRSVSQRLGEEHRGEHLLCKVPQSEVM